MFFLILILIDSVCEIELVLFMYVGACLEIKYISLLLYKLFLYSFIFYIYKGLI